MELEDLLPYMEEAAIGFSHGPYELGPRFGTGLGSLYPCPPLVYKSEYTAVGICHADHVASSIRRSCH
jgi:hypothetical protein